MMTRGVAPPPPPPRGTRTVSSTQRHQQNSSYQAQHTMDEGLGGEDLENVQDDNGIYKVRNVVYLDGKRHEV